MDADDARSREERTFRIWLNSMVAAENQDSHVSGDLAGDLRDGFVLLSAMDAVLPGAVEVSLGFTNDAPVRHGHPPAQSRGGGVAWTLNPNLAHEPPVFARARGSMLRVGAVDEGLFRALRAEASRLSIKASNHKALKP